LQTFEKPKPLDNSRHPTKIAHNAAQKVNAKYLYSTLKSAIKFHFDQFFDRTTGSGSQLRSACMEYFFARSVNVRSIVQRAIELP